MARGASGTDVTFVECDVVDWTAAVDVAFVEGDVVGWPTGGGGRLMIQLSFSDPLPFEGLAETVHSRSPTISNTRVVGLRSFVRLSPLPLMGLDQPKHLECVSKRRD